MKITNVSCTQFAGVRDRSVALTEGINVIFGKNESGKSTLAHLIGRTFFQKAQLDRRSDKSFFDLYFPAAVKGGFAGDFADGKITFETEKGSFTLTKEWGAEPRCVLSTPQGVIRDPDTVNAIIKEALLYGEGVYNDMLFSAQRNADAALQSLLDATRRTDAKQELVDAVSRTFAQSDGISMDKIEEAIAAKVEEIAGKHWDLDRGVPMRKAGRWSNGLGEILKAYYALEDANEVLAEIARLEQDARRTSADYADADEAALIAEKEYSRFAAFASQLTLQSERKKAIARITDELNKCKDALTRWPQLAAELDKAKGLYSEIKNLQLLETYQNAKKVIDWMADYDRRIEGHPIPSAQEVSEVRRALREIDLCQSRLSGMNVTAIVKMLGDHTAKITSLGTGDPVVMENGKANLSEAVKISVDGVMDLQLTPADIDVNQIKEKLAQLKQRVAQIFARYAVDSIEGLEEYVAKMTEAANKRERAADRLESVLGDTPFEQLAARAELIPLPLRDKDTVCQEAEALCGREEIALFITAKETTIKTLQDQYGTLQQLNDKVEQLEGELQKAKASLSAAEDIPYEYSAIADPEEHLKALQETLKYKRGLREAALTAKTAATGRLEGYRETLSGDPIEDAERAQNRFDEQKNLLEHWLHIAEVFNSQKEMFDNNPLEGLAARFTHYLGKISQGRVTSQFPDADRLSISLFSNDRAVDYGKLSEGTKETVYLAFRLAVLDHLFPNGGGVIIFDDPFTDMDADRTAQGCELIKQCAQKHQIIFMTCKEEYIELLGDNNLIRF